MAKHLRLLTASPYLRLSTEITVSTKLRLSCQSHTDLGKLQELGSFVHGDQRLAVTLPSSRISTEPKR